MAVNPFSQLLRQFLARSRTPSSVPSEPVLPGPVSRSIAHDDASTLMRFDVSDESLTKDIEADADEADAEALAWQVQGIRHWMNHDYARAQEALEHASVLAPLALPAELTLAECYLRQGQVDLVACIYRHALRKPQCPEALLRNLACRLGQMKQWALAFDVCVILAVRNPQCPHAQFGMAYYADRLGFSPTLVEFHLRRAHRLVPGCWLARINLATFLANRGKWYDAYLLVQEIDVERVGQPCWLDRMARIGRKVGDQQFWFRCERQLLCLEGLPTS